MSANFIPKDASNSGIDTIIFGESLEVDVSNFCTSLQNHGNAEIFLERSMFSFSKQEEQIIDNLMSNAD